MTVWPLRFQPAADARGMLFVSDAGDFFRADDSFLEALSSDALDDRQRAFLFDQGLAFDRSKSLEFTGFMTRWGRRLHIPGRLAYVILVPTLRCDLDCSYCQVSRVSEQARGFDWSDERLAQVLDWLDRLESDQVKIEFQGGEPLLRLDILERVRAFCRQRFSASQFVVCTNLQNVGEAAWAFLAAPDTFISTSFDGTRKAHTRQRTGDEAKTAQLLANITRAMESLGADKISALPTIDVEMPPEPEDLIAEFAELGFRSIYLRRINHQGFARKHHAALGGAERWLAYYRRFLEAVIRHNATHANRMEEYYFALILRRILQGGHNGHTDLRNPAWVARDFLLIDFDGTFYPTDEARMLTRIGVANLSIGSLTAGLNPDKIAAFDGAAMNNFDPDCMHCAYQPFCGVDPVDDISRYGRIDLPRHLTEHCRIHMDLFDLAFELLYSSRPEVRATLAHWLSLPELPPELTPVAP